MLHQSGEYGRCASPLGDAGLHSPFKREWTANAPWFGTSASLQNPFESTNLVPEAMTDLSHPKILVIDDDPDLTQLLSIGLSGREFTVETTSSPAQALRKLQEEEFHVVLTDVQMPDMNGIEFCTRAAALRPHTPVVVMTAFGSMEGAIAAIRAGAYDYLTKPLEVEAVALRLRRIIGESDLRAEVRRLRSIVDGDFGGSVLGSSPAMNRVFDVMQRVANSDAPVLVTGETGTGKEVLSRALHERSSRKSGPFVPVNCAAFPEGLLESELFGHVKGAFTNAVADRKGLFVEAEGGTLFLDEVGELPLTLQPKLLRALEERAVRPVGGQREVSVDFRLVAATNRDLLLAVDEGRFREDLYYRLNVVHIDLPPLRMRGNDRMLLASTFLKQFAERSGKGVEGFSAPVARRLLSYPWPGNVRELRNAMERAVALAQHSDVMLDDLPERVRDHRDDYVVASCENPQEMASLDSVEREYILRVLRVVGGNKSAAAKVLGLDRRTLYRKLERYEHDEAVAREEPQRQAGGE